MYDDQKGTTTHCEWHIRSTGGRDKHFMLEAVLPMMMLIEINVSEANFLVSKANILVSEFLGARRALKF